MGIAEDIKNLGEDIVTSYDMRVKAIGVLVKDTHNMLKGFQTEHKEMSDKLKADLAKGEEDRLKNFKAMMAEIQKFVSDIAEEVSAMIKRFQEEHKAMANEQRKNLEKGEGDRLKAFNSMMAKIQKGIKEIETYVKNKLKEFSDAHADMSEELKKALAKYVDDMVKATKKLMGDIQKRQEERNAEVADLLDAFKTEREEMAANWQALTATMAKKRGIMPKVEAEVRVRPVKEAIEEVEEEEVTPEMKLEKKVLKFIEKHPKGVKVGDMEETLGVARTRLGVIAKKLLDEGKVRKEENMYFPL
jgi:uncharacterized protein YukE